MSRNLYWGLLATLTILGGCATAVKTEFDNQADLSHYHRFSWQAPELKKVEDPILDSALLTKKVQQAVIAKLKARGYEESDDSSDFYVTYHTASKERLREPIFSVGIGYSSHYRHWGHGVLFDGHNIESYEEAVLIIDVIDRKSDNLVWRGWNTSRLIQRNFTQEAVTESVNNILDEFPPR